ncbi:hypothetical protein [Anaerosporobacter sp.]
MGFIQLILMIIFAVLIGIAYHKIFDVTYFSGKAIFSEIIVCLMLGGLIASKLIGIMKVLLPIAIVAVVILVIVSKVKKNG